MPAVLPVFRLPVLLLTSSEAMSVDGDCTVSRLLCGVISASLSLAVKSRYQSSILSLKRQVTFSQAPSSGAGYF